MQLSSHSNSAFDIRPQSTWPYTPSWLDRATHWVEQQRGPAIAFYIGLAVLLNLLNATLQWYFGSHPQVILSSLHVVAISTGVYYLALIHYLDRLAHRAVDRFRPALELCDEDFSYLRYRLTTLPARPVRFLTLVGVSYGAIVAFLVSRRVVLGEMVSFTSLTIAWIDSVIVVFANLMLLLFIYHTIHQLHMIHHIYTTCTNINLFHLSPLYAFSRLSAATALGWMAIVYVWVATVPTVYADPLMFVTAIFIVLLGMVAFLWPLLGIHHLLEEEKSLLQTAIQQRFQTCMEQLHRDIDERHYAETAPLIQMIAGLKQEMEIVERIPTWPWQPGTLRGVLSAVLLPLLLWIATRLLEGILTF